MEHNLRIAIAKALGAWEKDVCDLLHEDQPCNGRHYNPAGDDPDFQRLKKAIEPACYHKPGCVCGSCGKKSPLQRDESWENVPSERELSGREDVL